MIKYKYVSKQKHNDDFYTVEKDELYFHCVDGNAILSDCYTIEDFLKLLHRGIFARVLDVGLDDK